MTVVELKNISKSYGDNKVFSDFNCSFEYGKTYCIMGKSGCGKTTLLNIILGLVKPDSGDISGVPEKVSAVFQEDRLCEDITAYANVFAAAPKGVKRDDIERCLSELGLGESIYKPTKELSGGMKRRVAIARALIAEGDIYIFDEPFKGLDGETREMTMKVVSEYTKGKTLVFSTHDVTEANALNACLLSVE